MIRMQTAIRNARSQVILDALDAAATAATFEPYSGGQADPEKEVAAIPAHSTSTAYTAGDYVTAVGHYYRAENDGTSAATAPTWPTEGGTVADNDITWQDMGEIPELLGTLTLSQPAGTIANGILTLNTITEDSSADANNTATWGRFRDGDGNPVLDGSIGVLGSGADFIINTTNIVQGGPIRIADGTTPQLIEPGA